MGGGGTLRIWIGKKKKEKRNLWQSKMYATLSLYYLINSVISKTILFMFHLPHQKCKEKEREKKEWMKMTLPTC